MKERRVYTSMKILLDGSIVMWSKKPDTCHIAWQARFIERRHWPSITILLEGSAVMWSKNYVTPVSLNYQLIYSLRLVHIYIYIYIYIYQTVVCSHVYI